jgi:hypothetical protein
MGYLYYLTSLLSDAACDTCRECGWRQRRGWARAGLESREGPSHCEGHHVLHLDLQLALEAFCQTKDVAYIGDAKLVVCCFCYYYSYYNSFNVKLTYLII